MSPNSDRSSLKRYVATQFHQRTCGGKVMIGVFAALLAIYATAMIALRLTTLVCFLASTPPAVKSGSVPQLKSSSAFNPDNFKTRAVFELVNHQSSLIQQGSSSEQQTMGLAWDVDIDLPVFDRRKKMKVRPFDRSIMC